MVSYLILCRSLTYAQRTARVLERLGISGHIMRTPRKLSGEGCGYCVKISGQWLGKALTALNEQGLGPKQVYIQNGNDSFSEVVP